MTATLATQCGAISAAQSPLGEETIPVQWRDG
jgi:hypothetical protein